MQVNQEICKCIYKCSHLNHGYDIIPLRTKRKHAACDRAGQIHLSIMRGRLGGMNESILDSTTLAAEGNGVVPNITTLEEGNQLVRNDGSGENRRKVYVWCKCSTCHGRNLVHRNTERNHLALEELRMRLTTPNCSNNNDIHEENNDILVNTVGSHNDEGLHDLEADLQ